MRQAVANLPETYRSVLILRHYEGLKLREISEVLEIPSGTVNSRMAEALARLSRTLRPKLDTDAHALSGNGNGASTLSSRSTVLRVFERAISFFNPATTLHFAS